MNNYEVWKREMCNGNDLSKDFTFHYIKTVNGLKELRKQYNDIFYSKTTRSWRKFEQIKNNKYEYIFLKNS